MKTKNILLVLLAFVVFFGSCKKDELKPENIYLQVYDDSNSDRSFYPIDFIELTDGGFYILGETTIDTTRNWLSAYVMRTDNLGNKIWESIVEQPYMNPVPNLMVSGNDVIFFCLDENVQSTYVMKIDEASQTATLVSSMPDRIFPLAVSQTPDNGYLLLNYDRVGRNSQVSKYDAGFNQSWITNYNVIENVEDLIFNHLTRNGPRIPFFTGTVGSGAHYYANALYNYSLSTVFVGGTGAQEGVYYGYRYDGAINAMLPLNETTFALTRFSYSDQFILPATPLSFTGISNAEDLGGAKVAEIASDSENHIMIAPINGKNLLVYAFTTNTNQVGLYFYDPTTGEFVGKKDFGFSNPITITSVKPTQDGGLALLLETKVFGRFKRIALQKIPKEQMTF